MFWILDKLKLTNVKQLAEQEMSLLQVKPGCRDGEVGPNCSQGYALQGPPKDHGTLRMVKFPILFPIFLGILDWEWYGYSIRI